MTMAEKVIINHFCHDHPLILTENVGNNWEATMICFACRKRIVSECAYVCVEQPYCSNKRTSIIHQRCAELPTQISHPSHTSHPLYLHVMRSLFLFSSIRYACYRCNFYIDITSEELKKMDEFFGEKRLDHPRHLHPLRLMRKMALSFTCDACGVEDRDMAYSCATCPDLLIHKTCALLPTLLQTNQHHHQLSLASCFPFRFRKHVYNCALCGDHLIHAYWVYYCGDCRYFVHLKCATSPKSLALSNEEDVNDGPELVEFPVSDIFDRLIRPFVMRERGLDSIPDMPTTVKMPETTARYSYLFNYHSHHLSLVSEDDEGITLVNEEGEEEDELMKICDLCVTPISSPPYYQCASCKYFIHMICYLLPHTLSPSSSLSSSNSWYGKCPKLHGENHKFALYTSSREMDERPFLYRCHLCGYPTNGMVYKCEECGMIVDLKCASLPTAIKHASHSHSNLVMTRGKRVICDHCRGKFYNRVGYRCSKTGCDFALDLKCALLPPTVRKHEYDHHPLLLTFDASADHPSDFFCEFCEREMHPKKWMYHCRQCDQSYHTYCLETGSSWHRNVKFGRRFELDRIHPHPLTFTFITLKNWCHICRRTIYARRGFECASCYFAVCLNCGDKVLGNKM